MRTIDLLGQRFGQLTVIEKTNKRKNGEIIWVCQCDCGNLTEVRGRNLRDGHTTSCGCKRKEAAYNMGRATIHDLTGQRFGHLLVIENTNKKYTTNYIWKCKCDCGNICEIPGAELVCGKIKSCGCQQYNKEHTRKTMVGLRFGKLTVLQPYGTAQDGTIDYLCQCDCGNKKIINGSSLRSGTTKSCGCINYSIGEQYIKDILISNNIDFKKEYKFEDFKQYRYDFAILINNKVVRLIEFDGTQHYEPVKLWDKTIEFSERQKRDQEKNEYAKSHNIPLVRIPYWERDHITLDMLMGDKYLI